MQDPNLPPPPLPDLLLLRLLLLRMCRACACCFRARGHGSVRVRRRPRVRRWRTKERGRRRRRQRPSSFLLSSLARSLTVVARSPSPSLYPSISSERSRWSKGRRMGTKPYLQQISWELYLLSQRPKLGTGEPSRHILLSHGHLREHKELRPPFGLCQSALALPPACPPARSSARRPLPRQFGDGRCRESRRVKEIGVDKKRLAFHVKREYIRVGRGYK